MPLVPETGAGLADANAFETVENVTAWWALRGGSVVWTAATGGEREAGIVLATEYLCDVMQFPYRGTRLGGALEWPREGATYVRGQDIPSDVVPAVVRAATALLAPRAIEALRAGTTLKPPAERGGAIASESLSGVASVTYRDNAPAYTVHQDVIALLSPVLRERVLDDIVPRAVVMPDDPTLNPALRATTFADASGLTSLDPSGNTVLPPSL